MPMNIPPVSDLVTEAMTFLMVLHMTWSTHSFAYYHVDISIIFNGEVVLVHDFLRYNLVVDV